MFFDFRNQSLSTRGRVERKINSVAVMKNLCGVFAWL